MDLVMRSQNHKFDTSARASRESSISLTELVSESRRVSAACPSAAYISDEFSKPGQEPDEYIVPIDLKQTSHEFAVNFFIHHFPNGMYLDYVPHLLQKPQVRTPVLQAAFSAATMLYLAQYNDRSELKQQARLTYMSALQELQKAISLEATVVSDDLIASTMLMALCEAFSDDLIEASHLWTGHIKGALALVEHRPPETFQNAESQYLLSHVRSFVLLDSFTRCTSLPQSFVEACQRGLEPHHDFQKKFWELGAATASLNEASSWQIIEDHELLVRAAVLDQKASILMNSLPSAYKTADGNDDIWRSISQNFNHRVMLSLNTLRICRIVLNYLILKHTPRWPFRNPNTRGLDIVSRAAQASKTLRQMVESICDSVPESLRPGSKPMVQEQNVHVWLCSLTWPLSYPLSLEDLPSDLAQFIRAQLDHFAAIATCPSLRQIISQATSGNGAADR